MIICWMNCLSKKRKGTRKGEAFFSDNDYKFIFCIFCMCIAAVASMQHYLIDFNLVKKMSWTLK